MGARNGNLGRTGLPCSGRGVSHVPRTREARAGAHVAASAVASWVPARASRVRDTRYEPYCNVGSSRSRSQSPITETASVVTTIVVAGASMIQGARVKYSRP
ncbi:hypothetical protein M2427_007602 [Bradyrhizobium sp. BR13661]|nr:hypothetical protein [Bradyrhizobium sp. BR13661]